MVVTVGALDVGVLEKCSGGEHDVGVVGGVGPELLVHDGEEIRARHAAEHGILIGCDGGGVRVVDEECLDGGIAELGEGWPRSDMLTTRATRPSGLEYIRSGRSRACELKRNAPLVESWTPPPDVSTRR